MVDQSMAFIIPVLKKGVKYGFNLNNKFYATCESPAENLWPWIRPAKGCELSFREFEVAISEEMRSSKPHRQCLRSTRVPIFSYGGSQYQAARAISKSLWLERTGDRRRDQLVGNLDFRHWKMLWGAKYYVVNFQVKFELREFCSTLCIASRPKFGFNRITGNSPVWTVKSLFYR